ncbi:hypothetical protein IMG5_193580 [Ichthyophthirius multifiliis]|uniref:ATPase ASNA1 homolog n=1 Tax=Ichthyophthirius multifiliis TaxID=5932 RepID=G0R4K7_ICHMU|nr:hypothetical protein IMG5_193580 [Ichthyophthirius multifiliis]EGR27605.1 hypothetical protein IMG5_193580 [Ichthyophthirius multifiliis]|eukprot:XP_004025057.1 hypothetical protein IMG5_193580 [Ichthyophthirius multifiliis]
MEQDQKYGLQNILDKKTLKWIFVGGKGGVGKTTTSSSLATLLSKNGSKVLIISTDPAHNLCDCFDQKFNGKEPVPVNGLQNLYGMVQNIYIQTSLYVYIKEIDPKIDPESIKFPDFTGFQTDQASQTFMSEIISSVPGIDEAMSFSQLVNSLEKYDFDVIVFDTAPTGHTLRLLNFPSLLDKGIEKLLSLRQKFTGILGQLSGIVGNEQDQDQIFNKVFQNLEKMKKTVEKVNEQMKDPQKTTFVAVCIPEFLSMYETDRLVYQLAKYEIDISNIIINQVLFPNDTCKMCKARSKMQKKYIDQIIELYEDFHIQIVPLQENEVRGVQSLQSFCGLLLVKQTLPQIPQ